MAKAILNGNEIFGNVHLGEGSNMHNYSTTEQVVGTWIDGSTIYEITYELQTEIEVSYSSWTSSGITLTNIVRVIGVDLLGASNYQGGALANIQNNTLMVQTTRNSNAYAKYIVLRYTKTT